jgi:hypothetical protein
MMISLFQTKLSGDLRVENSNGSIPDVVSHGTWNLLLQQNMLGKNHTFVRTSKNVHVYYKQLNHCQAEKCTD